MNRIVLYKRGHFIETANSFFIIEISTTADGSLFVAAYDIQSNTSLLMQQRAEKAKKTLSQFNNDFQAMAESVQVSTDGKELRLHNGLVVVKRGPVNNRAIFSQDAPVRQAQKKNGAGGYLRTSQRNT